MEVLALLIRQNADIRGITFGKEENMTQILLFADDTTFFLRDIYSLNTTLKELENFQQFSGLKINREKSEIGWLGPKELRNHQVSSEHNKLKWVDMHESGIKILGIYFSHNKSFYNINNFERVFENFKTTLTIWKGRQLTPIGKIQIVKSLGLSKLIYALEKSTDFHTM
jgi:hypothetical protein